MVVKLAALCHMYTPFRSRHLLCFLFYAWILTDVIWKSINTYWMAYTVQICHLDLQSFAHWLPAISFWHLATSWTYEVSALIQFSSVAHHKLTFGSRAFRFSDPRVWNLLPVSIRETKSLPTFRRPLKTFYFQSAHPLPTANLAQNIFVHAPLFF